MRSYRFYHSDLKPGRSALSADEAHHARSVLRISTGNAVDLFDGQGGSACGEVVSVSRSEVVAEIGEIVRTPFEGRVQLTLATAMPRKQRQGFLFEKCTELGVWAFWPTVFERSVVKPGDGSAEKWRRTVVEACKQCGRLWLPDVSEPALLADVVSRLDEFDVCVVAGISDDSRSLLDVVRDAPLGDGPLRVLVFIGPEGGMTDDEHGLIDRPFVWLGDHTLRTETTCVAAAAICGIG